MRYFFHILNDHERLRDHDGEEFENLASAREEAMQSARDLIAEEFLCGRAAPSQPHLRTRAPQMQKSDTT